MGRHPVEPAPSPRDRSRIVTMRTMDADLQRHELLAVARALALDTLAVDVVRGLRERGIESLLLRGPALARDLYDDPQQRSYVDIDLLIEPDRFVEAEVLLESLGFSESRLEAAFPEARPQHAHTWVAPSGGMVDLHQTLLGVRAAAEEAWRIFSREAETMTLEGVSVAIPALGARAVIVALHAADQAGRTRQPLAELERALERLPAGRWEEAAAIARRLDALPAFARGLSLTARGDAHLRRLGIEPGQPARDHLRGSEEFHVAQGIAWLLAIPGVRTKLTFLAGRVVPSTTRMRQRSALARRGPLGLAAAHLVRWVRLTRAAVRALGRLASVRR
jgi:Uncharacterised nucleotidyltransferase